MNKELSERQVKALNFIETYLHVNGFPPTVREIGEGIGVTSTSLVSYYLKGLEEQGFITRESAVSRGIRVRTGSGLEPIAMPLSNDLLEVPFLGYIVAGAPIPVETLPGTETVEISRALFGRDTEHLFALRVNGDSMIDALIQDGDTVILKQQARVENGEMAAVWINNEETTLKKIYYEGRRVRLQPANPTMDAFYVPAEQVLVQGKVVMVIRQLS